jgi:hypothetical protein
MKADALCVELRVRRPRGRRSRRRRWGGACPGERAAPGSARSPGTRPGTPCTCAAPPRARSRASRRCRAGRRGSGWPGACCPARGSASERPTRGARPRAPATCAVAAGSPTPRLAEAAGQELVALLAAQRPSARREVRAHGPQPPALSPPAPRQRRASMIPATGDRQELHGGGGSRRQGNFTGGWSRASCSRYPARGSRSARIAALDTAFGQTLEKIGRAR